MDEFKIFKFGEFHIKKGKVTSFILSWQKNFFKHGFEAKMKFIEIYATFPPANAEIERGFSSTKRVKTDFRNKLSGEAPRSSDDIFGWERYQIVEARWKV